MSDILTSPFAVSENIIGISLIQLQDTPFLLVAFINESNTSWTCKMHPLNNSLSSKEQVADVLSKGVNLEKEHACLYFSLEKPGLNYSTEIQ